ncbi:MAG: hypothetical protein WAJ91_09580, partial [Rhodoplanes sp.]
AAGSFSLLFAVIIQPFMLVDYNMRPQPRRRCVIDEGNPREGSVRKSMTSSAGSHSVYLIFVDPRVKAEGGFF